MIAESGAVGAILVAAGRGSRMGLGYNKVLAPLCGKPVIEWTLEAFTGSGLIDQLVLVIHPDDEETMTAICRSCHAVETSLVYGGADRQDSVYSGLKALHDKIGIVLIHDGARPFIDRELIARSIERAVTYGAACAGVAVKDTIKIADRQNRVVSTPDRKLLWSAQTPQSFQKHLILRAYEKAFQTGLRSTDDAGIAEAAGIPVVLFEGSYRNIKLTSLEDMLLAEQLVKNGGNQE